MRPNLIFSRFCKLFSGPFKENILGIGLLFWRPQNNWHFWHFLVSIILKVTCPHPQDGWRHWWHHKQDIRCYLSITWIVWSPDFSPRMSAFSQCLCLTVDTVISSHRVQITKCWQGFGFHTWTRASKLAPVTSERWWMPVIQCLIFKGDDNLQSIMFTMNVSILPALHHQATWRWWNDVVGTPSTLIIIRSASPESLNVGV